MVWDRVQELWTANWMENGKRKSAYFSKKKHGDEAAFRMAYDHRRGLVEQGTAGQPAYRHRDAQGNQIMAAWQSGIRGLGWDKTKEVPPAPRTPPLGGERGTRAGGGPVSISPC